VGRSTYNAFQQQGSPRPGILRLEARSAFAAATPQPPQTLYNGVAATPICLS
jgi:hypothetical protein